MVQADGRPNSLEEAVAVATKGWSDEFPGAQTLIWDTMTTTGWTLLREYASSGVFSDKHPIRLGKEGTKSWHTNAMQGDYGAVQNSIGYILTLLQTLPMHKIIIFHAKWVEPKEGAPEGIAGGPDVPGSKAVRGISGYFDTVFRTDVGLNPETKKAGFVVHTVTKGIWKAGFRTHRTKQGLATTCPIGDDPSEFWAAYMKDVGEVTE